MFLSTDIVDWMSAVWCQYCIFLESSIAPACDSGIPYLEILVNYTDHHRQPKVQKACPPVTQQRFLLRNVFLYRIPNAIWLFGSLARYFLGYFKKPIPFSLHYVISLQVNFVLVFVRVNKVVVIAVHFWTIEHKEERLEGRVRMRREWKRTPFPQAHSIRSL